MTDANDDTIPSIPVDAPTVRGTYFFPFCAAMSHLPSTAVHLDYTRNEQSLMLSSLHRPTKTRPTTR